MVPPTACHSQVSQRPAACAAARPAVLLPHRVHLAKKSSREKIPWPELGIRGLFHGKCRNLFVKCVTRAASKLDVQGSLLSGLHPIQPCESDVGSACAQGIHIETTSAGPPTDTAGWLMRAQCICRHDFAVPQPSPTVQVPSPIKTTDAFRGLEAESEMQHQYHDKDQQSS